MKTTNVFREPIAMLVICSIVGLLAAFGVFSSMTGFPIVCGVICLLVGIASLRDRPGQHIALRLIMILLAPAVTLLGYQTHENGVRRNLDNLQRQLSSELVGTQAVALSGLEPLNVEDRELIQVSDYSSNATLIAFWARWCSPCWTELPELDELYRQHSDDGLTVIGVTRYDDPDDAEARKSQFEKDHDYVTDKGFTFPVAITENQSLYEGFQVQSLPSGVLIDDTGTIIAYGVGLDGGRQLMQRAIEQVSK